MELILAGLENKAISKRLFISVKTVESHKQNMKTKLGLKTAKKFFETDVGRIF